MASKTARINKLVLSWLWFYFGVSSFSAYSRQSYLDLPGLAHKTLVLGATATGIVLSAVYLIGWVWGYINETRGHDDVEG
jgi:hypothetical protein